VLHTALVAITTRLFGLSEFSLRLPALFGSAMYLWALLQLIERSFFRGHRWLQWLTYAVLIANPLMLDLMCVARGYSLGLGFLAWAALKLLDYAAVHRVSSLRWMSLSLGLAVTANLSFTFLAIATLCIAVALVLKLGFWRTGLTAALLPGSIFTFLLLILPMTKADGDSFYWGAKTIPESVAATAAPLFNHRPKDPGPFGDWRTLIRFRRRFVPIAMLILLVALLRWLLRGERTELVLLSSIFLVGLFGYWLANVLFGVNYPSERTGAPVILFFFLAFGGVVSYLIRYRWAALTIAAPSSAIFAALLIQSVQQMDPRYQWAWFFDQDNRHIVQLLHDRGVKTISTDWLLHPTMEFYRLAGKLPQVAEPLKRSVSKPPLAGHDAYVLYKADLNALSVAGLEVVYRNSATEVVVALPAKKL
jgi:hypothetical protein